MKYIMFFLAVLSVSFLAGGFVVIIGSWTVNYWEGAFRSWIGGSLLFGVPVALGVTLISASQVD